MPGPIKTKEEILILRESGRKLARILASVIAAVQPGVSTLELDTLADKLILKSGGTPSFKGYKIQGVKKPYPGSLCTSINDEVVHGIPHQDRILKSGDIIGLDIGMLWPAHENQESRIPPSLKLRRTGKNQGLYTDMAVTIGVGKISKEAQKLIDDTKEALNIGIQAARLGARTGDIGNAIEQFLKKEKYGIVRDLAGHGVGYEVHEDPLIPNFGQPETGTKLEENMVLAIEPMATLGDWRVILDRDQWTFRTADGSLAAHFEHTIVITKNGPEILTAFL